jgi:hypothetical protein|tara:strand:+ start:3689 stop:3928 length:240 start_codon:yes stop_codon:yes gene_type:complete
MPTKTKSKSGKWTSQQVRELVTEILTFQSDNIQGTIGIMTGDEISEANRLSREQANQLIAVMEPVLKDSAFKVLASKKF